MNIYHVYVTSMEGSVIFFDEILYISEAVNEKSFKR